MKCEKCGHISESGVNFCPNCGNKLAAPQPEAVAAAAAKEPKAKKAKPVKAAKQKKKKGGAKALIVVLVIIVLLIGAAAAVFFTVFEGSIDLVKEKLLIPEPVSEERIEEDIIEYDEMFAEHDLEIDDIDFDSRRINVDNMNERITCVVNASGDNFDYSAEYKITYVVSGRDWVLDKLKIEEIEAASVGVSGPDSTDTPSSAPATEAEPDDGASTGGEAAVEETAPEPEQIEFELIPFYGSVFDYYPIYAYDAYASSEVEYKGTTYYASNVIDGDNSTSWQEDAEDLGYGEWIDVYYDDFYEISMIKIRPGYGKDDDVFYRNGRPSVMRVDFGDGSSAEFELPDSNEDFYFELSYPVYTDWMSFTILDAYPGSQWDDTCISEICAFGGY